MQKKVIKSEDMPKSKILKNGKVALYQGFYYYKNNNQWILGYKA